MATRKVKNNGKDHDVEAWQLPSGKYIVWVNPPGKWMRQPDIQITNPTTGKTATMPGPPVEHDTIKGALDAGEDGIKTGVI